tara:strand:- start:410 stop:622 length:213 start_codon:yes stop_codon:yes gene_type:complete
MSKNKKLIDNLVLVLNELGGGYSKDVSKALKKYLPDHDGYDFRWVLSQTKDVFDKDELLSTPKRYYWVLK